MIKNFTLLFLLLFTPIFSQNSFPYERSWATYFGPVSGEVQYPIYEFCPVFFDTQNNIYISGDTVPSSGQYPPSYYNQFVIGSGGQNYSASSIFVNSFKTSINPAGTVTEFLYTGLVNATTGYSTRLSYIDKFNNKYYQIHTHSSTQTLPLQATANVYLPSPVGSSFNPRILLAKYDAGNTLVWATYLPTSPYSIYNDIEVDDDGSVYISGVTNIQTNLGTSGAFSQDYVLVTDASGYPRDNGYLIKLNANGQKIWGSYLLGAAFYIKKFGQSLYAFVNSRQAFSTQNLASAGSFQTSDADGALLSFNINDGSRNWGTYYGPTTATDTYLYRGMQVDNTGIYLIGDDYNASLNYFGTVGSYKAQKNNSGEIYLTKFNHSGGREWSTYFGSSGGSNTVNRASEISPIALINNEIIICGNIHGSGNSVGTSSAYQSLPESSVSDANNFFFANFSSSGQLNWASYYGGTNYPLSGTIYPQIGVASNNNDFYLFGATNSTNGYSTPGAWLQQPINPFTYNLKSNSFIAKFTSKSLAISEVKQLSDLVLYNNPNNGNFAIKGKVLNNGGFQMTIYDSSGRIIYSQKLSEEYLQEFKLSKKLSYGIYTVMIENLRGETKSFKMVVSE